MNLDIYTLIGIGYVISSVGTTLFALALCRVAARAARLSAAMWRAELLKAKSRGER